MVVQEWGQETKYYHQSPGYFLYQGDKKKTQKHGKGWEMFWRNPYGYSQEGYLLGRGCK